MTGAPSGTGPGAVVETVGSLGKSKWLQITSRIVRVESMQSPLTDLPQLEKSKEKCSYYKAIIEREWY